MARRDGCVVNYPDRVYWCWGSEKGYYLLTASEGGFVLNVDRFVMFPRVLLLGLALLGSSGLMAAPCMTVTLTGTQGGPPVFNGQAGSGTLVQYGDDENNCRAVQLQFDAGRGTTQQLS